MDMTTFLWRPESPLRRAGGIESLREEANVIVAGTLRAHPRFSFHVLALDALQQLRRFDTLWQFGPYSEGPGSPGASVPHAIRTFFPGSFAAFSASRQQTGTLPIEAVRWLHRRVFLAGVTVNAMVLAWAALRRRARPGDPDPPFLRPLVALILLVGAGIAANAVVAGASQPVDRYGSRVAWLLVWNAVLCLTALATRRRGRRSPG
jgi:hypothetical protein